MDVVLTDRHFEDQSAIVAAAVADFPAAPQPIFNPASVAHFPQSINFIYDNNIKKLFANLVTMPEGPVPKNTVFGAIITYATQFSWGLLKMGPKGITFQDKSFPHDTYTSVIVVVRKDNVFILYRNREILMSDVNVEANLVTDAPVLLNAGELKHPYTFIEFLMRKKMELQIAMRLI